MGKCERIKAEFESEFHVPIRIRLSFFTRHPGLLALTLFMITLFIIFFIVCVVIAFEEFFSTMDPWTVTAILGALVIITAIFFVAFNKKILLRIAKFAPEGTIALLKPLKNEIVDINVKNRLATARLNHPLARRVDVLCVHQGSITSIETWKQFSVDLYSTKPIDKARLEAKVEGLRRKGWKGFNIRLRKDGRVLELFDVTDEGAGYSLSQVLPTMLELVGE
jgi:hypothetical protein